MQHFIDESLHFAIHALGFMGFVEILHVIDDLGVEVGSKFLVLALEELEEDGKDDLGSDNVLATHDLEADDHGHAVVWVQY